VLGRDGGTDESMSPQFGITPHRSSPAASLPRRLASISALIQQAFQNWWPKKQDLDDVAFKTASRSLHPCLHRSLHPSLQTNRGKEKNDRAAGPGHAPRRAKRTAGLPAYRNELKPVGCPEEHSFPMPL
jgi:hypothetical protein